MSRQESFYHGSFTHEPLKRLESASLRGVKPVWDIADEDSVYMTRSEADAWGWASSSRIHRSNQWMGFHDLGPQRVYEVVPDKPETLRADTNLEPRGRGAARAAHLTAEGSATIVRELQGPLGSQFTLPGMGDKWGREYVHPDEVRTPAPEEDRPTPPQTYFGRDQLRLPGMPPQW